MKAKHKTYTLQTIDDDGVFAAQTTAGAGSITLNGAEVSGGVWSSTDGMAHQIGLASTGDLHTVNVTIVGTGADGEAVTETRAAPNNNTVETTAYFKTITAITVDDAIGTNMKGGAVDDAVSPTIPVNRYLKGMASDVDVTGTATFTVQNTFTEIPIRGFTGNLVWHDDDSIVSKTASTEGNYIVPVVAVRLKVDGYSTGAVLTLNLLETGNYE